MCFLPEETPTLAELLVMLKTLTNDVKVTQEVTSEQNNSETECSETDDRDTSIAQVPSVQKPKIRHQRQLTEIKTTILACQGSGHYVFYYH